MTPLEAAQAYAAQGYPVFPVNLDKTPITKHGFKDASTDPTQITEWFSRHPLALVGLVTGRKTDVLLLDVDIKNGKDGRAALKALGLDLSQCPQAVTPSGGSHYYFRLGGKNLRNSESKLGTGLDIRADGGFAIVPPSNPNPKKPGYGWVREIPLSAAPLIPDKIIALLSEKTDELTQECSKVRSAQPGQRNKILNNAAFRIAKIVLAGKLREDHAREQLTLAAREIGLEDAEILKVLNGAFAAREKERESKGGGKTQGHEIQFRDFEAWDDEVDGGELIDDIASHVRKHIAIGEAEALTIGAWILHAHLVDVFEHSPRLNITSPVRRCGKTTLLRVIGAMVPKPLRAENVTSAVVYRVIDAHGVTLLLDEFDSSAQENMELRSLLNAGHGRSDGAIRLSGDDFEPRSFKVFAATALCGIGRIPETLRDRSIIVRLRRRAKNESLVRFHSLKHDHLTDLGRKAARWAQDSKAKVRDRDPVLPSSLHDRAADNWRSLLQIAEVCGESCRLKLWQAAVAAAGEEEEEDFTVLMLGDVRQIFLDQQTANFPDADKITSALLVGKLCAMDERPWQAWGRAKKPLTQNNLARILRTFEVSSKVIRIGPLTPRGYERSQFEDAWGRYL